MKKKVSLLLIVIMMVTNISVFAQNDIENHVRAYLLADFETGEIIEGYNTDEVVEIASISKIMTYLVIMDEIDKGKLSLEDKIVIDDEDLLIGGSTLNVKVGDTYTIDEALDASLVISANNITYALAKRIAGTEENFVKMMNEKASEIHLDSAVFYNSTGLPVKGKEVQNKMKVTDVLSLSRHIIKKYPEVLNRTSLPLITGEIVIDGKKQNFIPNTNPLIGKVDGVDGLKTGFTNKAGYCLVSTFEKPGINKNEEKFRVIGIIMGAKTEKERGHISKKLIGNVRNNYIKKSILKEDEIVDIVKLNDKNYREIEVFPKEPYTSIVDGSKKVEKVIKINDFLDLPVKPGEKLGTIEIIQDGKVLFETDAIAKVKIKEANFIVKFFRNMTNFFVKADNVL